MMKYGLSPEAWLDLKSEIRLILVASAKSSRRTITYSGLTEIITLADLKPRSPELFALLSEVSEEEEVAGRGLLSAVVVRKDGRKSQNSGFIKLATRMGRNTEDPKRYWNEEIDKVSAYWRSH